MRRTRLLIVWLLFALAFAGCDKQPARKPVESSEPVETAEKADAKPADEPDASTGPAEQDAQADAPLIERPLLWKVEGPNGPLYLFGTIHGGIPGLSWEDFPAEAHQALDTAQTVVLEANLDEINQGDIAKKTMLPTSKSLEKMLGEEAFDKLVEATGSPGMVLDLMQPWAAYSELSRKLVGEGTAVDKMVQARARAQDKQFVYLESVNEQIDLLQEAVTAELLQHMLQDLEHQKETLAVMVDAYKAGDAQKLAEAAFDPEDMEKHPELYKVLFNRRNEAWVTELEKLIEKGDVFVAVGAGHLVGDDSVVAMLEKKGYEVERVTASDESDQAN